MKPDTPVAIRDALLDVPKALVPLGARRWPLIRHWLSVQRDGRVAISEDMKEEDTGDDDVFIVCNDAGRPSLEQWLQREEFAKAGVRLVSDGKVRLEILSCNFVFVFVFIFWIRRATRTGWAPSPTWTLPVSRSCFVDIQTGLTRITCSPTLCAG